MGKAMAAAAGAGEPQNPRPVACPRASASGAARVWHGRNHGTTVPLSNLAPTSSGPSATQRNCTLRTHRKATARHSASPSASLRPCAAPLRKRRAIWPRVRGAISKLRQKQASAPAPQTMRIGKCREPRPKPSHCNCVAQWIAHQTSNLGVAGSSPAVVTPIETDRLAQR